MVPPVHPAVDDPDYQLTGNADYGSGQVTAEHIPLHIADAHVQMGIVLTIHGIDGTGKRNNLHIPGEMIGMIAFFPDDIHA